MICSEELDELRAGHAGHLVELDVDGDCKGSWDPGRMQQLLDNLVVNALHHGEQNGMVRVALNGGDGEVRLSVTSTGRADRR